METYKMNKVEIYGYCGEKELYMEQIKQWCDTCINVNDSVTRHSFCLGNYPTLKSQIMST